MSENDREEKNGSEGIQTKEELENLPEESLVERIKYLEKEIEERKKEYNDLYDRYLRIAADFDNYKKRVAKEKADIIAYGNEELIKALLNVLDNLERAIEHSGSVEDPEPIVEGVRLVYKQFLSCLEKFGVKPIDASKGREFDPRYHQAIEYVESTDVAPGVILSEMLKGYTLKDRLLRPALVAVSKEQKGASTDNKAAVESNSGEGEAGEDLEEVLDLLDEDS
jgi:molecular chaperone GrpE